MSKFKHFLLIGSLLISAATGFSHDTATMQNDGIPLEVIEKASYGGTDKSGSIIPSINGHYLTVVFTENLGQVAIEVTTSTGGPVDGTSIITPMGIQIYIPNTGDYIVTFTLPNGDEYYSEFTVTD